MQITELSPVTANFEDTTDFQGWNCGKITKCGKYGNICGGFATKGQGDDIKQTFDVPAGNYSVTLDFIKMDSWFVWQLVGLVWRLNRVVVKHTVLIVLIDSVYSACVYNARRSDTLQGR